MVLLSQNPMLIEGVNFVNFLASFQHRRKDRKDRDFNLVLSKRDHFLFPCYFQSLGFGLGGPCSELPNESPFHKVDCCLFVDLGAKVSGMPDLHETAQPARLPIVNHGFSCKLEVRESI